MWIVPALDRLAPRTLQHFLPRPPLRYGEAIDEKTLVCARMDSNCAVAHQARETESRLRDGESNLRA